LITESLESEKTMQHYVKQGFLNSSSVFAVSLLNIVQLELTARDRKSGAYSTAST
jgi:hypothetical protein